MFKKKKIGSSHRAFGYWFFKSLEQGNNDQELAKSHPKKLKNQIWIENQTQNHKKKKKKN
jgi:hypothetical protein